MAYSTLGTKVAGENVSVANWSAIRGNFDFLVQPPRAMAYSTVAQAIASSTVGAALALTTEVYDTDAMFSTAANTRITVQTPGAYRVSASVSFAPSSVGTYRRAYLRKNGTDLMKDVWVHTPFNGATPVRFGIETDNQFSSGTYVEVWVEHDVGAPLNAEAAASTALGAYCHLQMAWLGTL